MESPSSYTYGTAHGRQQQDYKWTALFKKEHVDEYQALAWMKSSKKKMREFKYQRALQCCQYVRCENEAPRNGRICPETTLLSEAASKKETCMTIAFIPPRNTGREMPTMQKATTALEGCFQPRLSGRLRVPVKIHNTLLNSVTVPTRVMGTEGISCGLTVERQWSYECNPGGHTTSSSCASPRRAQAWSCRPPVLGANWSHTLLGTVLDFFPRPEPELSNQVVMCCQ